MTKADYLAEVTGTVELQFNAGRTKFRRAPKERLREKATLVWDFHEIGYTKAETEQRYRSMFFVSILGPILWQLFGNALFDWLWSKLFTVNVSERAAATKRRA